MNRYWKMQLTCLTPVHIGNGVSYNPSQYIYEPGNRGGNIYFLNESKWLKYLYEKKVIDLFARDLLYKINKNDKFNQFNIYDWLSSQKNLGTIGKILNELEECAAIYPKEAVYLDFNRATQKKSLNDVHPFIRSGNGKCYIPGSSIKGAVRTALLAQDMMQNPEKYKYYWQKAQNALAEQKGKNPIEEALKRVAKDIETAFSYPPKDIAKAKNKNGQPDVVNDLFKYLQVSDAIAKDPLQMGVVQKVDLGIQEAEAGGKPKTMPICRESILPENVLHFSISVEEKAVKQIGAEDINRIMTALKTFTQLQYDLQEDIYDNAAKQELNQLTEANLLLGGGAGYIAKTVLYALAISQTDNVTEGRSAGANVVQAFMREKFKRGRHDEDNEISPHTLKLTRYQNKTMLMGLCKVEVEQELC